MNQATETTMEFGGLLLNGINLVGGDATEVYELPKGAIQAYCDNMEQYWVNMPNTELGELIRTLENKEVNTGNLAKNAVVKHRLSVVIKRIKSVLGRKVHKRFRNIDVQNVNVEYQVPTKLSMINQKIDYEIVKKGEIMNEKQNKVVINRFTDEFGEEHEDYYIENPSYHREGGLKARDLALLHLEGRLFLGDKTTKEVCFNENKNPFEVIVSRKKELKVGIPLSNGRTTEVPIEFVVRSSFNFKMCQNGLSKKQLSSIKGDKLQLTPVKEYNTLDHEYNHLNALSYNYVDYGNNEIVLIGQKPVVNGFKSRFDKNNTVENGYYEFEGDHGLIMGLNGISEDEKGYLKSQGKPHYEAKKIRDEDNKIIRIEEVFTRPTFKKSFENEEALELVKIAKDLDGRLSQFNMEHKLRFDLRDLKTRSSSELFFLIKAIEDDSEVNLETKKMKALVNVLTGFKSSAEIKETETDGLTADIKDLVTVEKTKGFKANRKYKNLYSQQLGILSENREPGELTPTISKRELIILKNQSIIRREALRKVYERQKMAFMRVIIDAKGNPCEMRRHGITMLEFPGIGGNPISPPTSSIPSYMDIPVEKYHHVKTTFFKPGERVAGSRKEFDEEELIKINFKRILLPPRRKILDFIATPAPKVVDNSSLDFFREWQPFMKYDEDMEKMSIKVKTDTNNVFQKGMDDFAKGVLKSIKEEEDKHLSSISIDLEQTEFVPMIFPEFYLEDDERVFGRCSINKIGINIKNHKRLSKPFRVNVCRTIIHELIHYLRKWGAVRQTKRIEEAIAHKAAEFYLHSQKNRQLIPAHKAILEDGKKVIKSGLDEEAGNICRFIMNNFDVEKIADELIAKYEEEQSSSYTILKELNGMVLIEYQGKKLYAKGDLSILSLPRLSVAGTRNPSPETKKFIRDTIKELSNDFVIVSGLAQGCDTIAHNTCAENGGKTIAVLPSGLNKISPKSNEWLAEKIVKTGGLLLSEYNPNTPTHQNKDGKWSYIERDEIIAKLGQMVLICEAGRGTMHTFRYAKQFGKKILVQPIDSPNNISIIKNGDGVYLRT